ncbi:MAG: right-handed parallel beta-helix repeat-containing protein, partial [Thermoplasmatales archaeon]|nr:right-handed parallel beta-helix repeat-containing protein [Thermoplasmatales archaeon]
MTKNKKEMIIVTMLTITAIAILGAVSTINVNGLSKCESDLNAPKTIYVGGAGAGNYSTIQEGITVASEADIVFVYSGTYYENVVIDKTITLIGEDRNTTIIDGNGTGDVVYISADWVNVSGFGVRGSGSANIHPNFDAGIEIRSSSNTVTDCTCYNNHYGIYLYYSSNNNITTSVAYNNSYSIYLWYSSNNVITANQIYNNEHGIELWYSSNNILRDNILENNTYNFCVYGIYGADISYFYQDIDTSNTINDKAVYYIIGQNDILFDGIDVGYLALVSCRNIQVKNLKLTNNRQGLLLINTSHSTIISNYIYNNSWGIDLGYSSTNNITANQIYNNSWGIYLCTSPNNNITTNQIYNNSCGIDLKYSSNNNIITSNQIYNNLEGITPSSSSNNNISSNQIYNNKIYGIWLTSSSSNHITANQIYNNFNGIYLYSSSNTNISLNNIYNNDDNAVYLVSSSNNYLGSNNIYNNDYGISLDESSNNIMQNNTLENNTYNFGVYGVGLSDFYQDIDISNMINSKPIYYMVEQSHLVFDGIEVGYLGLVSCNNLLVKNLTLANNINGLLLANTSYSTVTSNQIYNNSEEGICLRYSTNNNKITANQIYNNYYGIYLWYSSNNNITINLIYNNSNDGIYLEHSSNNNITSNQIYDNSDDGIFLDLSSNNEIHYNNIYNNTNYGVYSNYYYYAANATYNWWGSVNGPGQDGANGVSGAVIYEPWLTEPWSGGVGLTQHDPIYINGNEDFATQAENESWAGNGTEADPYIIENWDIDASTAHGIEIRNTDVYFIIRSCIIHDGWTGDLETSHNGIYFSSVTNGSIDNVYGYNNHRAIYLLWSSNNIITNSTLYNNNRDLNSAGIYLENSGNNIIRYSICYNNANGIWLTGSNNQLFDCICYDNDDDGIIMAGYSKNNMVTNYISYNNNYGIRFWYTSHNLLMNYVAYNNYYGIYVHNSSNNVINLSTIYNSSWGIHIASYSNNNTIYHNNFINNTNNAYDGCSNYWDNGYPSGGNYWDDYTGSDANDDGIGDTPYPISGSGNYDYYPFMEPSGWEEVGLTPHAPIY